MALQALSKQEVPQSSTAIPREKRLRSKPSHREFTGGKGRELRNDGRFAIGWAFEAAIEEARF
jgi:hypothetical protein